jgi:hypothetical protein
MPKTDGSMVCAHVTSRRTPAMNQSGSVAREIRMLRSMSAGEQHLEVRVGNVETSTAVGRASALSLKPMVRRDFEAVGRAPPPRRPTVVLAFDRYWPGPAS